LEDGFNLPSSNFLVGVVSGRVADFWNAEGRGQSA
jgi:hypothetical protein